MSEDSFFEAIHLGFWDRASHWLGISQVGSEGWPESPMDLPPCTSSALGLHIWTTMLVYFKNTGSGGQTQVLKASVFHVELHSTPLLTPHSFHFYLRSLPELSRGWVQKDTPRERASVLSELSVRWVNRGLEDCGLLPDRWNASGLSVHSRLDGMPAVWVCTLVIPPHLQNAGNSFKYWEGMWKKVH